MRVGVQGADRSDLMGHVATDRLLNASLLKLDSQIEGRERDRIKGDSGLRERSDYVAVSVSFVCTADDTCLDHQLVPPAPPPPPFPSPKSNMFHSLSPEAGGPFCYG